MTYILIAVQWILDICKITNVDSLASIKVFISIALDNASRHNETYKTQLTENRNIFRVPFH